MQSKENTYIKGIKQQQNQTIGESFTLHLLSKFFWCIERSVDIDGADFLVQRRESSLPDLRDAHSKGLILGVVQSKFFESKNEVKIQKSYVLDGGLPRRDFFALLVTSNKDDETNYYFFTADEIVSSFLIKERDGKDYYTFGLRNGQDYTPYKNTPHKIVRDKINSGILSAEYTRNTALLDFISSKGILNELAGNNNLPNSVSNRVLQLVKTFDSSIINLIKRIKSFAIIINKRYYLLSLNTVGIHLSRIEELVLPFVPDEIQYHTNFGWADNLQGYSINGKKIIPLIHDSSNWIYFDRLRIMQGTNTYTFPIEEKGGYFIHSFENPEIKITIDPRGCALSSIWYNPNEEQIGLYPLINEFYSNLFSDSDLELFYEFGLVLEKEVIFNQTPMMVDLAGMKFTLNKNYSLVTFPFSTLGQELLEIADVEPNPNFTNYFGKLTEAINGVDDNLKYPFPLKS